MTWDTTTFTEYRGERTSTYLGSVYLSNGDYSGAGTVGKANLAVLEELLDEHDIEYDFVQARDVNPDSVRFGFRDLPELPVLIAGGAYGSTWALIREDDADDAEGTYVMPEVLREVVAALETYPVLDEGRHSELECEAQDEAWESWVRGDLYRTLPEDVQDALDARGVDPDDLQWAEAAQWEAFRDAAEAENVYWVEETGGGMYVPVDRLAAAYEAALRDALELPAPTNED